MRYDFTWREHGTSLTVGNDVTGEKRLYKKIKGESCLEACFKKLFGYDVYDAEFFSSPKGTFIVDFPSNLKRIFMTYKGNGIIEVTTMLYKTRSDLEKSAIEAESINPEEVAIDFFRKKKGNGGPYYERSHEYEFADYRALYRG